MATDIVGSRSPTFASDALRPSTHGYGQNGYGGASSDEPGQRTTSGFLPQTSLEAGKAANKQTRKVDATPFPAAFGCKGACK